MPEGSRRSVFAVLLPVLFIPWLWGSSVADATVPPAHGTASAETPSTTMDATLIHRQVSQQTAGRQGEATLAALPDGGVVAVWTSTRQTHGNSGVMARRFDSAGRPLSPEVRINQRLRGLQDQPAVAWVESEHTPGAVWVVWRSQRLVEGSVQHTLMGQRLTSSLEPLGAPWQVEGETAASTPVVVHNQDTVLVAWARGIADDTTVVGRRFGVQGEALGPVVSLGAAGGSARPLATALDRGFLVTWVDGVGAGSEIVARSIDTAGAVGPRQTLVAKGSSPVIEPTLHWTQEGQGVLGWLEGEAEGYGMRWRRLSVGSPSGQGIALGPVQSLAGVGDGWISGLAAVVSPEGASALVYGQEAPEGQRLWLQSLPTQGSTLTIAPQPLTSEDDRRKVSVASGAQRAVWTHQGTLGVAWHGQGERGGEGADPSLASLSLVDGSAAGLTLWNPAGLPETSPATTVDPGVQGADSVSSETLAAAAPIWDPNAITRERQPALRGAGGDFGFEAIPSTGWTPPDPEVAVGPERVIGITNGAIAVFDKLGNLEWQDEIENSFGFWGELGTDNFVFDPEVRWDVHDRRFVAMANERSDDSRSYFLLAVSKDERPDDRDDWWKYRLDVTALAGSSIDSPNLAVGRDALLLTADFFGPDRYLLYLIDKSTVLEGGIPVTTDELITGQQSMGLPSIASDTGVLYILESTEQGTNTTVRIHAITEPFTNYQRQVSTLTVPTYTFPADPPQQGTSSRFELFEPRFWSVTETGGSLWAVHHVDSTRARVRWYEIDLEGWPLAEGTEPTLTQSGEIDVGGNVFTFFPSIHADSAGNAAITFARSANDEFPSMGRALRAAGDPPNTFRPLQMVQTSTGSTSANRWGDYSGTQAEPDETGVFWGHHEFLPGGVAWSTWIARYELRSAPFVLTANPPAAGGTIQLLVTGATPGENVVFYATDQGLGLSEIASLEVVLSLEGATEVGSAIANGLGQASVLAAVPAGDDVWVQAAEMGLTTDFHILGPDTPLFTDGFESGDTTAWSSTQP